MSETVYSITLRCVRCGAEDYKRYFERDRWLPPKGWFCLEDGWRCGCVLKRQAEGK